MDRHTPAQRSYNMSQIRSTNTALERRFFELLDGAKVKYEKQPKLYGRPDCLVSPNIVVFVDGDFWHGWHFYKWRDRIPQEYWVNKIERNMRRDKLKFRKLRASGYSVVRVWEHTLKASPGEVVAKIAALAKHNS